MRRVRHIGARTVDGSTGLAPTALALLPVLRGERLGRLQVEWYGATQADEPPEQVSLCGLFVGYVPGLILTQETLTTAKFEIDIYEKLLGDAIGNKARYGGEPNDAADEDEWMGEDQIRVITGARLMWSRVELTDTRVTGGNGATGVFVSGSGTNTVEGKQGFMARTRLRGGYFPVSGYIAVGYYQPQVGAQTTFGVTEMDDQITLDELASALVNQGQTQDSDTAKIQELLFGGDNYIEADTLKDFDGRIYARVDATFYGGVTERAQQRLTR